MQREPATSFTDEELADLEDMLPEQPIEGTPWPDPPDEAAYHGLAGDIVRAIAPHTESDPVAILLQTLTAFGSVAGRHAYYQVEADRHYPNLYGVLVGATSKARKGTSWGQVRRLYQAVDEGWAADCVQSGLSSGEGLIWAVHDPIEKTEPVREKGRVTDYQTIVVDPGVEDKRLLAIEPEFARTLRVATRDGNTLSALIRDAWDTGNLRCLTKSAPARATDAHVSMVGHITRDELRRYLDATETANGFANRYLWVCVRRSRCLPEGGRLDRIDVAGLVQRLAGALEHARRTGRVTFDDEARATWHRVYPELSDGQTGLLGAVTSRAEAQAVRLALIYALMDSSAEIRQAHLMAGLALWEYAEQSARYVFGDATGDPLADEILRALRARPDGMTRTEIRDLFKRHQSSASVARALGVLVREGRVRSENVATGGRPVERWHAL